MTGKSHQVIGVIAGTATFLAGSAATYNPATAAWVLVLSSLGALLPDIDSPSAKIWQDLPFGHAMGELVNPLLKHRNLSHSLLGAGIIAWASWHGLAHIPAYWGVDIRLVWLSFLAAYSSHLLADMVTVEGVPLLFPYQRMYGIPPHPFQGIRIETGKWFENLVVFPLVNVALIALWYVRWDEIRAILFR